MKRGKHLFDASCHIQLFKVKISSNCEKRLMYARCIQYISHTDYILLHCTVYELRNFFSNEFTLLKLNYILWMHWIFCHIMTIFNISVIQWQRHACIEAENFHFIECAPCFQWNMNSLNLLWFLFLMECQIYWRTMYSQSIQSSRLHSFDFQFSSSFFCCSRSYLPIYTDWMIQ